jgi:hypothetical protein
VSVLGGLRAHNLVHLKGPSDALEATDALQLLGYAAQYMVLERIDDPSEVAMRVIAPKLTPRFKKRSFRTQLRRNFAWISIENWQTWQRMRAKDRR